MIKLETDLRSIQITSETGEETSYLFACYTRSVPFTRWAPGSLYGLAFYSLPLLTFVSDALVKRIEPGVTYRLPEGACKAIGSDEDLSLIPLNVEFTHTPYVNVVENDAGSVYVPPPGQHADVETIHLTRLRCGSWFVCGVLQTDQAREWAGLSDAEWNTRSLFNRAHKGLDPSWQPLRHRGRTTLAFAPPLSLKTVEVSRETA